MTLRRHLDALADPAAADRTLAVLRRSGATPLEGMLHDLFADQPVAVEVPDDVDLPADEDVALLLEAGEVVASSPMRALEEAILLVNSDLYTTGTLKLHEADLPDVLTGLADTPFRLRGYPLAHKEKLLLVAVSRQIELFAHRAGAGTLRASFQRLSRIDDEVGTRRVYEALAGRDLDVHVYGEPDRDPGADLDVTVHGGYGDRYSDSWFVVFTPEAGSAARPAALLALEVRRRHWDGFWTFDPGLVSDVDATIRDTF